jgi:hypothetical protein
MSELNKESPNSGSFAPRCLSIDLEVSVRDARIHRFAAVRGDTGQSFVFEKGNLASALSKLDEFADGSVFLLGHNLIDFDLPHLAAAKPDLRLLSLPAVDTLRLNPLAFPRNPFPLNVERWTHLTKDAQRPVERRAALGASARTNVRSDSHARVPWLLREPWFLPRHTHY